MPYVKEAIILNFEVNQTNKDVVLLFNFTLKKSPNYTFERLDIDENDDYHNLNIKYTYLIYPLKKGDINIDFDLLKKVTNDASIAYSFSGDRDNIKILESKNTQINLKPLTLHIKALPKGTQIVGDFNLSYNIPKHEVKAYEPLPFSVSIKGKGYPPLLSSVLKQKGRFRVFSEEPNLQSKSTLKGTYNEIKYTMALSHIKDFILNPIEIKAFNPLNKQSYTLSIAKQNFHIIAQDSKMLIDKIDNPKALKLDLTKVKQLLTYIIIFLAGYITALVVKSKDFSLSKNKVNPIAEKIEACETKKDLLQVLISLDNKKLEALIEKIEKSLYNKEKISLKSLKKKAIGFFDKL